MKRPVRGADSRCGVAGADAPLLLPGCAREPGVALHVVAWMAPAPAPVLAPCPPPDEQAVGPAVVATIAAEAAIALKHALISSPTEASAHVLLDQRAEAGRRGLDVLRRPAAHRLVGLDHYGTLGIPAHPVGYRQQGLGHLATPLGQVIPE